MIYCGNIKPWLLRTYCRLLRQSCLQSLASISHLGGAFLSFVLYFCCQLKPVCFYNTGWPRGWRGPCPCYQGRYLCDLRLYATPPKQDAGKEFPLIRYFSIWASNMKLVNHFFSFLQTSFVCFLLHCTAQGKNRKGPGAELGIPKQQTHHNTTELRNRTPRQSWSELVPRS